MKKYEKLESSFSEFVHCEQIPLLVSSQLLRRRSMGQIDVSWIKENKLYVAECKSGNSILSYSQKKRLKDSLFFLGGLFDMKGRLIKVEMTEEFAKSSPSAYPFKVSKIMELT